VTGAAGSGDELLGVVTGPLGILLLERAPDGSFRRFGPTPAWVEAATDQAVESPMRAFPFLETFIDEAEEVWNGTRDGCHNSGYWTQGGGPHASLHLTARAVRSGGLQLLAIVCDDDTYRDQQRLAQRGRESALALEQLDREIQKKEILFHCIVHDLAVPLNVLTGTLGLLEESGSLLPIREKKLLDSAFRAATRQSTLVREILDAFAAEREEIGRIEGDPGAAPDAWLAARETIELLEPEAERGGVSLRLRDRGPADDHRGVAERSRLLRVLANLIENAIRHSPAGGTVSVQVSASDAWVQLDVEDQGPGVAPELRASLFEKLVHGGSRPGRAGLGLYFCAITVRRWGGEIDYCDRVGGGARFSIRLRRPRGVGAARRVEVDAG
jgi:signal transduction histidine kinase